MAFDDPPGDWAPGMVPTTGNDLDCRLYHAIAATEDSTRCEAAVAPTCTVP
jgi:hypothetical protein